MIDANLAAWYVQTLAGDANAIIEWRCIHDTDRGKPGHNYRGTLTEVLPTLEKYNNDGYGIFCSIQQFDGQGRELTNVSQIRTHVVDIDNPITAQINFDRAANAGASFAVQSSPGKFHLYWRMVPYVSNDFYTLIQRKLAQFYDGDPSIIDASRVMRVPGFIHRKGEPHLVTTWPLAGIDRLWTAQEMETTLAAVNVVDHFNTRSPLGEKSMEAPALDWLQFALTLVNPNDMDRPEWLSLSAAIKQAGWNHTDPETLYNIWMEWCNQYEFNDVPENLKLWDSIKDTEVGWGSIERKTTVKAYMDFGFKDAPTLKPQQMSIPDISSTQNVDDYGEIMNEYDCQEYFKNCYFVEREGKIFTPSARFMKSTQFNGKYGGKRFMITSTGLLTDEPWKAALRSTCWTIPKVDHVRFIPEKPSFEIINDALGRKGLNTYIPAKIESAEGDLSMWFDHVNRILPDTNDQRLLFEYMAHNVRFPGYKIPWAPLLQSAEGIGKTVFVEIMQHSLGSMYAYAPNAQKLVESGSTFNAWMRGKLMIIVNEIKVGEKRDLIEILKPMISDKEIEVQGKGVDQEMEDNPANWFFFSNFKDAIPINQNGRRYAIFYSCLQSEADILQAGMDDAYFNRLFAWLRDAGGFQAITHWLLNYPIEKGAIPKRAPKTSSHNEALAISRSPMELLIAECVADGMPGFRGGYVSTTAVKMKCKLSGMRGTPNTRTVQTCLEQNGYVHLGRAARTYFQEDTNGRAELYGSLANMTVEGYGPAQAYE